MSSSPRPPPTSISSSTSTSTSASTPSSSSPRKDVCLPQSRVKTIMKSSPDVEVVSQESLFLITKATELFIMYLSKLAQRNGDNKNSVGYHDLADVVQRKSSMEFLHDIVPKKIKYSQFLEMVRNEKFNEDDDIL